MGETMARSESDQRVEQRGFADVGAAQNRDLDLATSFPAPARWCLVSRENRG